MRTTETRIVAPGVAVTRLPLGCSGVTLLLDGDGRVVAVEITPSRSA